MDARLSRHGPISMMDRVCSRRRLSCSLYCSFPKLAPQRWQDTSTPAVQEHDVVIAFEERIYDAVIEDLQMREPTEDFKAIHVICLDTKVRSNYPGGLLCSCLVDKDRLKRFAISFSVPGQSARGPVAGEGRVGALLDIRTDARPRQRGAGANRAVPGTANDSYADQSPASNVLPVSHFGCGVSYTSSSNMEYSIYAFDLVTTGCQLN